MDYDDDYVDYDDYDVEPDPSYSDVHVPYEGSQNQTRRFATPDDYFARLSAKHYLKRTWVRFNVEGIDNGYYLYKGYPFFVHDEYAFRYSKVDTCLFELVDTNDYSVREDFTYNKCKKGYDLCAVERDDLNNAAGYQRFFCGENAKL